MGFSKKNIQELQRVIFVKKSSIFCLAKGSCGYFLGMGHENSPRIEDRAFQELLQGYKGMKSFAKPVLRTIFLHTWGHGYKRPVVNNLFELSRDNVRQWRLELNDIIPIFWMGFWNSEPLFVLLILTFYKQKFRKTILVEEFK